MRPFLWEATYPAGVVWDAPLAIGVLPEKLDQAVERFGALPALRFRGARLSYRELGLRVDRLAAGLIAEGLTPGQRVGLFLPNTPFHPIAFFAVLRAGGIVVHLTPLDPVRAVISKLHDSGATWVISTDLPALMPTVEHLAAEGFRVFIGHDAAWDATDATYVPSGLPDSEPVAWPRCRPEDVALLQFTGGTTGQPRAVMLSHANITAATSIYEAWNKPQGRALTPADRVICVLPLFHIYALTAVLLRGLLGGAEILLRARFDAASLLDDVTVHRATVFLGVPTMWTALAALEGIDQADLSSLRIASSGGAPLPVEIATRIERLTGHRLGGGWGMTETAPAGTNLVPGTTNRPGGIGLPLPGIIMQIVALDDASSVLGPHQTGEIRIKGPNVTSGYWNRPEDSAAVFADGFLLTGDVGYMDERGEFFIVDRKKDMILSGGFNVYPSVIEDAIYEHPDVAEAVVVGIDDAYRGQSAKAFIVMRAGRPPLTLAALRAFLTDRIGKHEMPTALELRDQLPKTAVGKLSRALLKEI